MPNLKPKRKQTTKRPQKLRAVRLSLWQRLDRIRVKEDLTDTQFAQVLGMSRQQYSNLKTNEQRLTTAWRIAVEAMEEYGTSFIQRT